MSCSPLPRRSLLRQRSHCALSFTQSFCKPLRIIRPRSDIHGACSYSLFRSRCSGGGLPAGPICNFREKHFGEPSRCLTPVGFLLDLLFGNTFFIFPNKGATLGCEIPAAGGTIPIEEFVFYLTGFMLVLLSYIWCDEYWMGAYNVPDYTAAAKGISRIVRFHFASVVLGAALIAAAILYRKFLSGADDGFPWYFIYLVCASLIPSAGFFHTARPFINWRAFSFTFFCFSS
jgi:hypothetical protein